MDRPGWIKVWREMFSHWIADRPFCKGFAWLYLIAWAAFEDEQRHFMGRAWSLKRGTHVTSCRQLGRDWGWDHKKVGRYLKTLQQSGMIRPTDSPPCIVVTICNYDTWQSEDAKRPTERQQTPQQVTQPRPSDAPGTPHEGRREEGKKERRGEAPSLRQALLNRNVFGTEQQLSDACASIIARYHGDEDKACEVAAMLRLDGLDVFDAVKLFKPNGNGEVNRPSKKSEAQKACKLCDGTGMRPTTVVHPITGKTESASSPCTHEATV